MTRTSNVANEVADGDELSMTGLAREKRLQLSTVYRWIIRGLPAGTGGRVQLEAIKRGRTWLTSRAALRRFFGALPTSTTTDETSGVPSRGNQLDSQQRAAADAKKQLKDRYDI